MILISSLLLFHNSLSSGIRIYYFDNTQGEVALEAYQAFLKQGIPRELLVVKKIKNPCADKTQFSFMDICITDNGKIKVIRKSSLYEKTIKPLTMQGLK